MPGAEVASMNKNEARALTDRVKRQLQDAILFVQRDPTFGCKAPAALAATYADAPNVFFCAALEYNELASDSYLKDRVQSAVLALRSGGVDPDTLDLVGFKNMPFANQLDEFYLQATFVGQGIEWVAGPFASSYPDPWRLNTLSPAMRAWIRGETEEMPDEPPPEAGPVAHREDGFRPDPPDFSKEPHRLLVWFGRKRINQIMVSRGVGWDEATRIFGDWLRGGG
jgi:hypothetical protein